MTTAQHQPPTVEDQHAAVTRLSESEVNFLLAQYTSLRDEVLKRIEVQHQLILGTVVAVGTILTVGTQTGGASLLLIHPFLALFLALAWSQNDFRNRQITRHLRLTEDAFLTDTILGWEHSRTSHRLWIFGSRKVFAARGVFIGSQILTLLLFWITTQNSGLALSSGDQALVLANLVIIVFTLLVIGFPSRAKDVQA